MPWLANSEPQLCLTCLLRLPDALPDASIMLLTSTPESQISPPSLPPSTFCSWCNTWMWIKDPFVHVTLLQAIYMKIVQANRGPDPIRTIPVLSVCKCQLPQYPIHLYNRTLKSFLEPWDPWTCVSLPVCQMALMLFRRKSNLPLGICEVFFSWGCGG